MSQTPFGARVVFRKLVLSWLFFRKLLNRSFCCSSQGCCIIPLSAFLWGVIIAVSVRSGVTSPRVTERMGGRGRKSRGKPYPQWEPRRQFGSPLRCEQKQRVSGLKRCVCQVKTVGEGTQAKEWVCLPRYPVISKSRAALLCKVSFISPMLLTSYPKGEEVVIEVK